MGGHCIDPIELLHLHGYTFKSAILLNRFNARKQVHTKKGIAYIMHTFIFNEMSRLQYNLSIGCSTIWRKYSIIIGKLRMIIFIAMEMEKLY